MAVKDSTDPVDLVEGKNGNLKKGDERMNSGQKKSKELATTKQRLTVTWSAPGVSGNDTGHQSRQMMGAAESGCCRQSGSPCSPKKYS